MRRTYTALLPYLVFLGTDFYLLPLLIRDTGTAMLLMLCVMPLAALVCALLYGVRRGFSLALPLAAFLLFLPTVPLYYNESAWPYAAAYAAAVLAGVGFGGVFHKKK